MTIPLPWPLTPVAVNRYLTQKDHDQQVVFHWYHSQGNATAGELAARIEMVKTSITRHRTHGALVRVSNSVVAGAQETSEPLFRYIQAMYRFQGTTCPTEAG